NADDFVSDNGRHDAADDRQDDLVQGRNRSSVGGTGSSRFQQAQFLAGVFQNSFHHLLLVQVDGTVHVVGQVSAFAKCFLGSLPLRFEQLVHYRVLLILLDTGEADDFRENGVIFDTFRLGRLGQSVGTLVASDGNDT